MVLGIIKTVSDPKYERIVTSSLLISYEIPSDNPIHTATNSISALLKNVYGKVTGLPSNVHPSKV